MKTWRKPAINIYDVKMDEKIASSGDDTVPVKPELKSGFISYYLGFGGGNFRFDDRGRIQETNVTYILIGSHRYVYWYNVDDIRDCKA